MKNKRLWGKLILLLSLFLSVMVPLHAEVLKVDVDGIIDPITAEFILKAIEEAESSEASILLIRLSTPGGLGISMQEIVRGVLNAEVPVVCFVAPSGSRAASAGFFVLLAADIAAMAPGTNTGAATPVFPLGGENETITRKVTEDYLAGLRAVVNKRNRNYEMAEKAVREGRSYTAAEALEEGLIDLIVEDEGALLKALDGMTIARFDGGDQILETTGQSVRTFEKDWRQRFLSALANPNFALILGLLGILGLYFEFTHPGFIFPGVFGGIALLLALLGFSMLSVTFIGVLLILLALGLFIAEATMAGFGLLGAGGIVALLLGIVFLVDSPYPELRIGWPMAFAVAVPFGVIFIFLSTLVVRSYRSRVSTGSEGMVGTIGEARTDIDGQGGKVFVLGELWGASSSEPIEKGARVRVIEMDGLHLLVEPVEGSRFESANQGAQPLR